MINSAYSATESTPPKHLIEIGISAIHQDGQAGPHDPTVEALVARALQSVNHKQLPVRCALLLATPDWCRPGEPLPGRVRRQLREALGYNVPLIGGSMARLYCSIERTPFIEQGVVLLVFCSNDFWASVIGLERPFSQAPEERKQRLQRLARDLEDAAGVKLGPSAERSLFGLLPGIVSDGSGNQAYFDHELHQEILAAFGYSYPLVGASATGGESKIGYQFANDECLESGLALAMIELDVCSGAMMAHGFTPTQNTYVVVDEVAGGAASNYEVTRLDGQPAARRVEQLRQQGVMPFGNPLFGLPYGDDFDILWPIQSPDRNGGSLRLKRKVAPGDRLCVLSATPAQMMDASAAAIEGAIKRSGAPVTALSLILGFVCFGRLKYFDDQQSSWQAVIDRIRKQYLGVPMVGGVSAGEFGVDQWRRTRANNMSISLVCLADAYTRRARTRALQRQLLSAAGQLTTCDSPVKVMQAALNGAVTAGATGGQICLVDAKLRRILGKGFGHALQVPYSSQDWCAVAEITDRPTPRRVGGPLPGHLRDWSMPVVSDLAAPPDSFSGYPPADGEKPEDLLTLIVRTLHAVFVPDSTDPTFFCDPDAVAAGHVRCQLAIPLVGSQGRAIATLQVGFPDDTRLDQESFAHWVHYAQKIAIALERAQEIEERHILGEISRLSHEVVQSPVDPDSGPYNWCKKYVEKVVELLGPDGAHMRVLEKSREGAAKFRLVGGVGCLADLLAVTRLVIGENDGSTSRKVLEGGGKVSNTRQETAAANVGVEAIENKERYGKALNRELHKLGASAWLPLRVQGRVLGSFVMYSRREHFFTERVERIVRAAARDAGALLQAKKTEYYRAGLEEDRALILPRLTSAIQGSAAEQLKWLVEHVRQRVRADIASLFVWHAETDELILRVGCNWFKSMEGRARYKRGVGWTGSLALDNAEAVSILPPSSAHGTRQYYRQMIPPEHRGPKDELEARIGIRLTAGDKLVGILTLSYYQEHADQLVTETEQIVDFLKAVAQWITLGVELTKHEAIRRQMLRLVDVENEIVKLLVAPDLGGDVRPVADAMCKGFKVERVTFYRAHRDKRLTFGWSSQAETTFEPTESMEPLGAMRDVVVGEEPVLIPNPDDPRLSLWPNRAGVKGLFAVPVLSTTGDVRGVLEFVNRTETPDHPFSFLDRMEQGIAWDVARSLAAAIANYEINKLTNRLATATKIGMTGLFGALVMHQVMAPFSIMRGSIDWLLRHLEAAEEERVKYIKRIEASTAQAIEIINQAAHRGALGRQRVSLRTIIRQAYRAIEPEIRSTGVKVKIEGMDDKQTLPLYVDFWSVVVALVNLLSNALDAMKGSGVLTISTQLARDGQHGIIRIHNTGPSLTDAEISQFFQAGFTTKNNDSHFGLGLPLARQAIEGDGGTIRMRPSPAGGVEVVVSLPIVNGQKAGVGQA
jgi:signal transduction histidine kinase/GAF domain-containing protein